MKKINKEQLMKFAKKYKLSLICLLVAIIALIIGLVVSTGFKKVKIAENEKSAPVANTSEGIIKEEVYEGLKFNNITLISKDGYSTFTADVTNTNQTNSSISDVDIVLKDKDGNIVITLRGNIGDSLKPNETVSITASTKGELKSVVSKEITKHEAS